MSFRTESIEQSIQQSIEQSIQQSIQETEEPEHQLKKRLSALDLTVFGIGVIIGAGIFTVTGRAAQA